MALPGSFWWGTAASSTQCEGSAPRSDWRRWEELGRVPPSGDGNGFATRYAEDFALLAEHGLDHHRLSIEWARIEPEEGHVDGAAVEHYRDVLRAARAAGISVWVCLHHFTLPGWFADDRRGFLDERSARYHWARHVDRVAETFGDLVFGWQPINEPAWYAAGGFLLGVLPPGRRDPHDFTTVLRTIDRANHDAARLLRGNGQPVATIHNLSPVRAADASPEARAAAARVDDRIWASWLGPLRDEESTDDFDLIGFSYYSAIAVGGDGTLVPWPPAGEPGPLGYVPWAEGLGEVLRRLADEVPGKPLLVAECGLGTDDDEQRVQYLAECLGIVDGALGDGIDVRGLFHWTAVDNYEWHHGFDVRFGLFDAERRARPSAEALAGFATRP